jgi:hypothetical protein
MDIDVSFALVYSFFPLGTADNTFELDDFTGPSVAAHMGSFSFSMSEDSWYSSFNGRQASAYMGDREAGATANISSDFELTPFVRGRVYDRPAYYTEYVDARGYTDNASGEKYTYFQNIVGLDLDWLMAKDKDLTFAVSRLDTIPLEDDFDNQRGVIYNQVTAYQQQINPVAVGGARANYTWRLYDEDRGDQFQHDYTAFLGAELSENTTLRTSLGYSLVELVDASQWESNGTSDAIIGSIQLRSQLTDRLSHMFGYDRSQRAGFDFGVEVVDSYNYTIAWNNQNWMLSYLTAYQVVDARLSNVSDYTDWIHQLTASKPLSEYLTLTMATAYTIRDNGVLVDGDLNEGDVFVENDYDSWAGSVGLLYNISQHWDAVLYYEHFERISEAEILNYNRDTVGVTLTYNRDL